MPKYHLLQAPLHAFPLGLLFDFPLQEQLHRITWLSTHHKIHVITGQGSHPLSSLSPTTHSHLGSSAGERTIYK